MEGTRFLPTFLTLAFLFAIVSCRDSEEIGTAGTLHSHRGAKVADQITVCIDVYTQGCSGGYCSEWTYSHSNCSTKGGSLPSPSQDASVNLFTTSGFGGGGGGGNLGSVLQNPQLNAYFNTLTQAEKDYFTANWADIPQAYSNKKNAEQFTSNVYCRDDDWGNWNAFKHAYWTALNNWKFGTSKALLMGQNHESESPNNSARDMDFHNNNLGVSVYRTSSGNFAQNNEEYNTTLLAKDVYTAIASGRGARVITENDPQLQGPSPNLQSTNDTGACNLSIVN